MSREVPSYRKHANGRAFVRCKRLNGGKNVYLGAYGSPESKQRYRQVLKTLGTAPQATVQHDPGRELLIAELVQRYDMEAPRRSLKEHEEMMLALRHLAESFGDDVANSFGPKKLRVLRRVMIQSNLSRGVVNHRVGRIKRFFGWCSQEEIIRKDTYSGLLCVKALQLGDDGVREAPRVKPIERRWVELTLPYLTPTVAAMVEMQLICGMRPQDVCQMRGCDITKHGNGVWIYNPPKHKNAWREKQRLIAIPRLAQSILTPFLKDDPDAFIFSPAESESWRNRVRTITVSPNRTTKIYPSELKARAKAKAKRANRKLDRARPPRERYDTDSYRRAIGYGLKKFRKLVGVSLPHWHPHRLRHTISTEISQAIGEQQAQRWLGHENLETTGIYTERQVSELIEIANLLDQRWAK